MQATCKVHLCCGQPLLGVFLSNIMAAAALLGAHAGHDIGVYEISVRVVGNRKSGSACTCNWGTAACAGFSIGLGGERACGVVVHPWTCDMAAQNTSSCALDTCDQHARLRQPPAEQEAGVRTAHAQHPRGRKHTLVRQCRRTDRASRLQFSHDCVW